MPEPVYVIDTEMGAAQLLKQFPDKDIRIASVWEAGDDFQTDPITCLENIDLIIDGFGGIKEGATVVIDSGTDLWQWICGVLRLEVLKVDKTANVKPSDYAWANSKYAAVILKILKNPVNLCITARDRTIYSSASLETTGQTEAHWQKWTPNYLDFTISLQKVQDDYYGVVEKCRYIRDKKRLKSQKDPTWDWLFGTYRDVVPFQTYGE